MKSPRVDHDDNRMKTAVLEFQRLIEQYYPQARFEVKSGDDPAGTYLIVTVDLEDPDEVVDVYAEKLLTLQVDEGLPFYIGPVHLLSHVKTGWIGAQRVEGDVDLKRWHHPSLAACVPMIGAMRPSSTTNDGVQLYYEDVGEGRPLLLIPGWTCTHSFFQKNIIPLAQSCRVIAPDMRAHGDSETVT